MRVILKYQPIRSVLHEHVRRNCRRRSGHRRNHRYAHCIHLGAECSLWTGHYLYGQDVASSAHSRRHRLAVRDCEEIVIFSHLTSPSNRVIIQYTQNGEHDAQRTKVWTDDRPDAEGAGGHQRGTQWIGWRAL